MADEKLLSGFFDSAPAGNERDESSMRSAQDDMLLEVSAMNRMNRLRLLAIVCFTLLLATCVWAQSGAAPTYDVIITHGRIIDGSGNPWCSGDIAIQGNRI